MSDSLIGSAPSLDEPLEILEACHGRIEHQLATLERLADHLPAAGLDGQARQAAATVIRYFDTAGQHHHEDEEVDLFPKLLQRADEGVQTLVSQLLDDHARMSATWGALRRVLMGIREGREEMLDRAAVSAFAALYRQHIARENTELLPLARRTLTMAEITAMSLAMTRRRRG